jgi:putative ABC transport system permease protein
LRAVLPGYFEMLNVPLLAGRAFVPDDSTRPDAVIIDDASARAAFGGESAIGKQIVTRILGRGDEPFTVVGVVRRARHASLLGDERAVIYFPWYTAGSEAGTWAVKTRGDLTAMSGMVRDALGALTLDLASNTRPGGAAAQRLMVNDPTPLSVLVDRAMAPTRFALIAIGVFAVIAAVLAAIGLYGVLSSSVRQRTSEIGVRMAFGADAGDIFSLVIGEGLRLSIAGLCVGLLFALVATRVMTSLLVGVEPFDPLTFATMAVVFVVIAVLACWIPARRGASLDPNVALRDRG